MNRREVIAGLTLPLLARSVRAQQPKMHRIAIVVPTATISDLSETGEHITWRAFFRELRALGYREGVNLEVIRRSAEGRTERYAALAKETAALEPDLLIAINNIMTQALREATDTIPILFTAFDPVGAGFAASLARPGRNLTDITSDASLEIFGKYLDILRTINPRISKIAFLIQRLSWEQTQGRAIREAAARIGVEIVGPRLDGQIDEAKYQSVISAFVQDGAEAMIASLNPENFHYRQVIADLAIARRMPVIHSFADGARAGALAAYSIDFEELLRVLARYADRILKGANPAEMPMAQPTRWQLIFNLKTARQIGVDVPPTLLALADEVIE